MNPRIVKDRSALIEEVANGSIGAEIGVLRGDFSECILKFNPKKLYLIDCWSHQTGGYELDPANIDEGGHESNYRHVIERFEDQIKTGQVEVIRSISTDAARQMASKPKLDWVYLDANHSFDAVLGDLSWWESRVMKGGKILGHDYASNPSSIRYNFHVIEAVTIFCSRYGWKLRALTEEEWPSYMLSM